MVRTGVFFHPLFNQKPWPIIGSKFKNFPNAMDYALKLPNVVLYEPKPVPEPLLYEVHDKSLVEHTRASWYYEGARLSVGGCVEAAEKIWLGEISNSLVFDVAAGHHAGPSYAWGGTYLSCNGPTVAYLRRKYEVQRFAILDTDSHHGDGDRAMFMDDENILHVCFCSSNVVEGGGTKIDVNCGWSTDDEQYLKLIREEFLPRVESFKPDIVIHLLGHDTCQGDYGDRGLTREFIPAIVVDVKKCVESVCEGRYLVVTHGGARSDIAEYIFPRVIEILAR